MLSPLIKVFANDPIGNQLLTYLVRVHARAVRDVLRQGTRKTEVADFGVAIGCDQHVGGFEVAVHAVSLMHEGKRA